MALPDGLYDPTTYRRDCGNHCLQRPMQTPGCSTCCAKMKRRVIWRMLWWLSSRPFLKIYAKTAKRSFCRSLIWLNSLLVNLRQRLNPQTSAAEVDMLVKPPQVLRAIYRQSAYPVAPETGLSLPWLFTAGKGSPSLLTELRRTGGL